MGEWSNTDVVASIPKYAASDYRRYGTVYGVDRREQNAANSVPVSHSGWVALKSYVDQHGHTRYRSEVLVANKSISDDITNYALTGTVDVSTGNTTIVGTDTLFGTEVFPTNKLKINDVVFTVESVSNSTELVVSETPEADAVANAYYRTDEVFFAGDNIVYALGCEIDISGKATNVCYNRLFTVTTASFVLTGEDVDIYRKLTAVLGEFTLTGVAATLKATRTMPAVVGAFVETGVDVTLTYTQV